MNTQTARTSHSSGVDVFNDVEDLLKGIFSPKRVLENSDCDRKLAIDLIEKDTAFELVADMPGVDKNDINITLENGVLTISVQPKKTANDPSKQSFIINERSQCRFSRSVRLAKTVNEKSITANYVDGVLTLNLEKTKQHQPRKIAINS